jgi:hypothetical protein
VLVLENNGEGVFSAQPAFALPQTPNTGLSGITVADFNGDGNMDVAAEDSGDGAIFVLYGNGSGGLTSCSSTGSTASIAPCQTTAGQTISGLPIYPSQAFLTANFNGFPGLLFSNTNNGMTVLLGSAAGTLQTTGTNYVGAGENPAAVVSGDFNNDGFPDVILAVLPPRGGVLSVFLNNTAGILQGTQAFPAGIAPAEISLLQNFFGNNELDVAVAQAQTNGNAVTVLGAPASGPNGTLPQSVGPFTAPPDEAITAMTSGCVLAPVLRNFTPCATPFVAYATYLTATSTAAAFIVKSGTAVPAGILAGFSSSPVTAMAAGDFNGDGITDLAFAIGNTNTVLVFTGNGDGTFSTTPLTIPLGENANPVALAVADFNGDGEPDLAVLSEISNTVVILLNNAPNCSGTPICFQPLAAYPTGLAAATGMTVGDFNNDGKPDIAATSAFVNGNPSAIAILLNQGGGTFPTTANPTVPVSFLTGPIATADFNGDGNLDLAVLIGFDFDTVQILTGDGTGNFATTNPPTFSAGLNANGLVVANFKGNNDDGLPDIAMADGISAGFGGSGNMVTLLLNGTAAATTPPPPTTTSPLATFSPDNPSFEFGNVAVGQSPIYTVTLSNTGTGPLLLTEVSFGLTSSPGFSFTTTCALPLTMNTGDSCTATVTFAPIGSGPSAVSLGFADNAGMGESNLPSVVGNPFFQTVSFTGTGVASGSPPAPAMVNDPETISVTDAPSLPDVFDGETVSVTDTPNVIACQTITIVPSGALPTSATVGSPYSQLFITSQGLGSFTWSISGNVPPGLSLNTNDPTAVVLTGTPTSPGTFTFTVTATASNGCPGSGIVTLTVNPAPTGSTTTTITSTSSSYQGVALPANFALTQNPITVDFSVQTASGTPTGTVKVTDGFNDTCSGALTGGTGSCALTISEVGTGSTPLIGAYTPGSSSSGLLASTSNPLAESVVQISSCGTLPSVQTSAQGTTVTFTFTTCSLLDVASAPQAVVTGCPPNATCSATVTPVSGKLGVDSVVVTIVLGSFNIFQQGSQVPDGRWRLPFFGFAALLMMLMALRLSRQNRARPRLIFAAGLLLALMLSGLSGCNNTGAGTPPNTYTVNVTVTTSSFTVTVPLTLTVTK